MHLFCPSQRRAGTIDFGDRPISVAQQRKSGDVEMLTARRLERSTA